MPLNDQTTHTAALPVYFDAPLENPSPQGLMAATRWIEEAGPSRFLSSGVDIRVHNFGGDAAFGVWDAGWCVNPDDLTPSDIKTGTRPASENTFAPLTVWAYDQCDMSPTSQGEVRARVQQTLRLREPIAIERELSPRLLTAPALPDVNSLVAAIGKLEGELAKAGVIGLVHLGAQWAAPAVQASLVRWSGAKMTTPMGHQYVFGGGYVQGLGGTVVATSQTYGWRDAVVIRDVLKPSYSQFVAVAERSLAIGYETAIASIEIV